MILLLYSSKIVWLILGIILMILNMATKKLFKDREKSSPFECGFDPNSNARLPFSLHFFLIAVIFIIFDVELTLLLPVVVAIKTSSIMHLTSILTLFTIILLVGLYHEWKQGALTWAS